MSHHHSGPDWATLRRVEVAQAAEANDSGEATVEGASVSMGLKARVTDVGDYRFFAGRRSDPFFFDRRGAVNNLQFTGDDFSPTRMCAASCSKYPALPWGAK